MLNIQGAGHAPNEAAMDEDNVIRIAISACLLGQNVRYDGTNKLNALIVETLGPHVELVPFCPEVAIGLGIPRPPIHLVDLAGEVRAQGVADSSLDPTEPLRDYGQQIAHQPAGISGFIFKARSPSCGVNNVKIFQNGKLIAETGTGLFAAEILKACPTLPIAQESDLETAEQCEVFYQRILRYHDQQSITKS